MSSTVTHVLLKKKSCPLSAETETQIEAEEEFSKGLFKCLNKSYYSTNTCQTRSTEFCANSLKVNIQFTRPRLINK